MMNMQAELHRRAMLFPKDSKAQLELSLAQVHLHNAREVLCKEWTISALTAVVAAVARGQHMLWKHVPKAERKPPTGTVVSLRGAKAADAASGSAAEQNGRTQ